ncbi:MAG: Asp-tRNA(Asn)/Glu-tRNA(Gln) amidotransferase subunit GatB [Marinifilaceae bacterium]
MTNKSDSLRITIGLEIHAQLKTQSKAFSADPNRYGEHSNTMISPYSLGHPGTLPRVNQQLVHAAILLGLACQCRINRKSQFSRKNYFYPDLPKGYQITQQENPICKGGRIPIRIGDQIREIALQQIHMEEDSGKSSHQKGDPFTRIDLNRSGVPLLEIVTAPEIQNPEEAHAFVREIRRLLRHLEISDANMEEGSLRCDANISVQHRDQFDPNLKVEVKNINSMNFVRKALHYEILRQKEILQSNGKLKRETRRYNPGRNQTLPLRTKEEIQDYRYFPEPDLPPLQIQQNEIDTLRKQLPTSPWELEKQFAEEYQLKTNQAQWLVDSPETGTFFRQTAQFTKQYREIIKWLMGPIQAHLKETKKEITALDIPPEQLASLINMIGEGNITHNTAVNQLFPLLLKTPNSDLLELARKENLIQTGNNEHLMVIIQEIISKFPVEVENYRAGKMNLIGFFMGEVMKVTQGKANPQVVRALLTKYLNN